MNARNTLTIVLLAGTLLGTPAAAMPGAPAAHAVDTVGTGWIVNSSDNICGLDDPRMLSHPAKVDYGKLLSATPELKKMREEKIDPKSSKGIQLRQAAVDRVRKAANGVRASEGHCSVWKKIRHRDGRAISDITDKVKQAL